MSRNCCIISCLFLLSFIFPPLVVLIDRGCGIHFLVNLLLTTLFIIPGTIHAIWICFFKEREHYQVFQSQIIITHPPVDENGVRRYIYQI
uniref:Plasma membrane proteolipid 3 n=1 Tax=Parastrongyloides trichosuri TaxID=131310 RepID=A0A0N4ZAJ0_PARTI